MPRTTPRVLLVPPLINTCRPTGHVPCLGCPAARWRPPGAGPRLLSKVMPTGFGAMRKPPAGRENADLTAHDEVSYRREGDHLVLAPVLLAQSQPDQALGLLELMDALADSRGRTGA